MTEPHINEYVGTHRLANADGRASVLVLADTHLGPRRAGALIDTLGDRLDRADLIIHAGDITSSDVLESLVRCAPVTAVKGNNDADLDLPHRAMVRVAGYRIAIVHDSGAANGRPTRLATMFPDADVVVFGHSHLPWNQNVEVAGRVQRHFNPGSATQRRRAPTRTIGWIEIDHTGLRCRHEHI